MEYELHNSSGTDDENPPSHFDRVSVGGHYSGTRRFVPNTASYPRMQFDMESQIHQIEQEAYRSVLRAFKAQSDAISWEKEGLITELRKELRVSDDEHRELLSKVNADDIICTIREWRKAGENQTGMFNVSQPLHDLLPSPTVSASWKKQKTPQSGSLAFNRPMQVSHNQPAQLLPASTKWAPSFDAGGQKSRPGPHVPGLAARYASTGPTPRGVSNGNGASPLFLMNTNAEIARRDPLIGRKVMTKWPADENFYEAVITDYNPQEGRHALVYDRNTPKEAWEWVDLKEIAPEDIRWVDEDAGISHQSGVGIQGPGDDNNESHGVYPNSGRGKGAMRDQNEKEFPLPENGVVRKAPDEIEILHTDTLIKEVQKMFSTHPNLLEIEKAKKMLKEHEQALMDVISKLGDAANSGSGAEQRSPHGQSMDVVEQRWRNSLYSRNNHVPFSEADTRGVRANGSVVANGSLNQQEDEIIEIQ